MTGHCGHANKIVFLSATDLTLASDYPYPADFLAPLPAWPVKYACSQALAADSPLEALAAVAGSESSLVFCVNHTAVMYNGTDGTRRCFDIEQEFSECAGWSLSCGVW